MKPLFNPYLPLWEFVPDGEPHIFNGRLYVYGSHDRYGGEIYCMDPYTVWSAPLDDLSDWTNHGISYTGKEDPRNTTGSMRMFAPDVCFKNGKYYLYSGLETSDTISVAVSDKPEGPFRFYGHVHYPDGTLWGLKEGEDKCFDPGIFVDEDGRVYLYSGFSITEEVRKRILAKVPPGFDIDFTLDGSKGVELEEDMLTIKDGPYPILPGEGNSAGTGFEGHEFFEASSMRKFNGKYYAIYSSVNGHELCYAISDQPLGGFQYQGVLHSNGDIGFKGQKEPSYYHGNNHGSMIEINGDYYVFGHRHTAWSQYQRQGVAEKLAMNPDGTFDQARMTSYGLTGKPFDLPVRLPAAAACVLYAADGACKSAPDLDQDLHPAIVLDKGISCIANLQDGAVAGFRSFSSEKDGQIRLTIKACSDAPAQLEVFLDESMEGSPAAILPIPAGKPQLSVQQSARQAKEESQIPKPEPDPAQTSSDQPEKAGQSSLLAIQPDQYQTISVILPVKQGTFPLFIRKKGAGRLDLYEIALEAIDPDVN